MTKKYRKWNVRLIKLGVCALALWYLSSIVTLEDYARLAEDPEKPQRILDQTDQTLRLRDPETGQEREVPRSALAAQDDLKKGHPIEFGLKTVVFKADRAWIAWSLLACGPGTFIIAWRLRLLLTMQNIHLSLRNAILLTFGGNFLNFVAPGITLGDVYKAYHITRLTHKRTEGITVVLLDRVVGLISFLLIAALGIVISWQVQTDGNEPMIGQYGRWVGVLILVFLLTAGLFFSRRIRRMIRYEVLLNKLPFADKLRRVDETVFSLRYHLRQAVLSLAVTLVCHFFLITAIYLLARGLGLPRQTDHNPAIFYLACLLATSVGYLLAAVPISIQGFGLLEAVFFRVLVGGGWCNASEMLVLTLGARLIQIVWALPGVIVIWLGFRPPPPGQIEEQESRLRAEGTPDRHTTYAVPTRRRGSR